MPPSAQPVSVNLLEHDQYDDSVVNRLITWAVTYGRYIMIATEIIVLLAFISRFSLDRKLTDLREEINQKQVILEANQSFEQKFKDTQKRLDTVREFTKGQTQSGDALLKIQGILPADVYLSEFQIAKNKISLGAVSGTTESFAQFLARITSQKEFSAVELVDIRKSTLRGIEFRINATLQ